MTKSTLGACANEHWTPVPAHQLRDAARRSNIPRTVQPIPAAVATTSSEELRWTPVPTPRRRKNTPVPKASAHGAVYDSSAEEDVDEGWLCRSTGQCDLMPKMRIDDVRVIKLAATQRTFQIIHRQDAKRPDHILTWTETKGVGITVESNFGAKMLPKPVGEPPLRNSLLYCVVPTETNTNKQLREQILQEIKRKCNSPSARAQAFGYTDLQVKEPKHCRQVVWKLLFNWQIAPGRSSATA